MGKIYDWLCDLRLC